MDLTDEFRVRSERCLKLAREAPTAEAHTHWLAMAQLWLSLAEHAEEQEAGLLARARPPLAEKGLDGDGDENEH